MYAYINLNSSTYILYIFCRDAHWLTSTGPAILQLSCCSVPGFICLHQPVTVVWWDTKLPWWVWRELCEKVCRQEYVNFYWIISLNILISYLKWNVFLFLFPTADFLCKDRRSCVSRSLVCDGRAHCYDGSDEANCRGVSALSAPANVLKCRMGSRLCNDGKECVLFSHVCDGEIDCLDGSDEQGCQETCKTGLILKSEFFSVLLNPW